MAAPARLPGIEQLRASLLQAYAAHWLGLVPERPSSEPEAEDQSSTQPLLSSFFRKHIGSRMNMTEVSTLVVD